MRQFCIDSSVFQHLPELQVGVILAYGIDNSIKNQEVYANLISKAYEQASAYLQEDVFSQNPVVLIWREAFTKFKTKKGARSSIEALLKRVEQGKELPSINPLVDLYNVISLTYALPCGAEDLAKIEGDISLTKAMGNEHFVILGSSELDPPHPEEIIYKDEFGAICRSLNWRESARTFIEETTHDAFLCMELVDSERNHILLQAMNHLAELIQTHLGGQVQLTILNQKRPIFEFH